MQCIPREVYYNFAANSKGIAAVEVEIYGFETSFCIHDQIVWKSELFVVELLILKS